MAVHVQVEGELIVWARERSGRSLESLLSRFPTLTKWESGLASPTLKQLEQFANFTHTPIGYLFLQDPPEESVPIPDFRTIRDTRVLRPSPDLLDTIYLCEQRQEWYREYARRNRLDAVPFVGSLHPSVNVVEAASHLRAVLSFDVQHRGSTWAEAFKRLVEAADAHGILVMVNGVVGRNTHRKLNPQEFRGFALVDDLAPVIFVNGADTKAAQIFTLTHELAHVWIGQSAISDADVADPVTHDVEKWCNQVAAEFLVPIHEIERVSAEDVLQEDSLSELARRFKVSTLVVLRRSYDVGILNWETYQSAYANERTRVLRLMEDQSEGSGGNFYNTRPLRVSKRLARALIASTLEGDTLHRDAFRLLGFKKVSTFQSLRTDWGYVIGHRTCEHRQVSF